ncbi:hypothetical protein [Rhodovulum marinum]|uniref:hypothetical protein n=1 Tax=Rhodovulum marinum TaxID=320662 RepID=UPI001A9FB3E6|nr:hypothetical protein [Rhodovulum marinum]
MRWLKREGLLEPGRIAQVTWSRRDRVTGEIGIIAERGRIILDYRQRPRGGEWETLSYPVDLVETPCNLGGARPWFLCPNPGCRRRVAILYADRLFVCRHCLSLTYPSQREDATDRAARRADRIRDKLGWKRGILNGPGWLKPKGMHWKTFQHLCWKHDLFASRALAGMREDLDRRYGRR